MKNKKKKRKKFYSECIMCEFMNTNRCDEKCLEIKNTCFNCAFLTSDYHKCIIKGILKEEGKLLNICGTRFLGSKCLSWRDMHSNLDREQQLKKDLEYQ